MRHIRALLLAVSLAACAVGGGAGVASAQEPDAAEDRAMTFEAADEGAQTENVPGGALLIGAYGLVFLFLLGYVVSLGYRQARTRDDIERLRRDLARAKTRAADEA